jgi:hypothetical protein
LRRLNDQKEIDKLDAVRYLHLDSTFFQENPAIHSDSTLKLGSRFLWWVTFAAVVNCSETWLVPFDPNSRVFGQPVQVIKDCDFDPSGGHTRQTHYRKRGGLLYVYDNAYWIKGDDLVPDKKRSRYSAFRLPELTILFKGKPVP